MSILKQNIAQRFAKAHLSYQQQAEIQQQMSVQLMQLMQHYIPQKQWQRVFEIGCGTGNLTRNLQQNWQIDRLYLNDLYADVQPYFISNPQIQWYLGDIEKIAFPQQLELICSSSVLQWLDDFPAFLTRAEGALQSEAYLCFSSFGPQNCYQIKTLTGCGLDYLSLPQVITHLMQKGFEVLHHSEQQQRLWFSHPYQVLKHLKATGVTATAKNYQWNKASLNNFYQQYQQFSKLNEQQEIQYALDYHPIFIVARKVR